MIRCCLRPRLTPVGRSQVIIEKSSCPRDSLNQDVGRMRIAGWCRRGKRTRPSTRTWVELVEGGGGLGFLEMEKGWGGRRASRRLHKMRESSWNEDGAIRNFSHPRHNLVEINRLDGNRIAFPFPLFFPGSFFLPLFFFFFLVTNGLFPFPFFFLYRISLRYEETKRVFWGKLFFSFLLPEKNEEKKRVLG